MGVFGSRGRARARRRAETELGQSPSWQVLVEGRGWVCPFCGQVALQALPEAREAQVDAALDHLEGGCPGWRGGEGQERPLPELRRVVAQRELRRRVKASLVQSPSWQLIDIGRQWYCPYCGDGSGVVVPTDRKMGEDTLQAIVAHVEGCYAFRGAGQEKPLATLKAVVKHLNQSRRLVDNVRKKLEGDPAWRRKDPKSRWVCPYCLATQEHIDLSTNMLMFETAPALIGKHLAGACEPFKAGRGPVPIDVGVAAEPALAPASPRASSGKLPRLADDDAEVDEIPATDPTGRGNRRATARREVETVIFDEDPLPLPGPAPGRAKKAEARSVEAARRDSGRPEGVQPGDARPDGDLQKVWGRDAALAADRRRGPTLKELESSGDMIFIDDPEVRSLTARSPSGSFAPLAPAVTPRERPRPQATPEQLEGRREPPREGSGRRPAAEWRREIERELARVRSLGPGGSGEHTGSGERQRSEDDLSEVARALHLAERGVEARRVLLPASPARGDFVDLVPLPPDHLVIVAGGCLGEEAEAPLIAAMAKNLCRQRARRDVHPAVALREVNAELFPELDGRVFVALLMAVVDLPRRSLTLARAGLSAPIVVNPDRRDGHAVLHTEGMVLGIDRGPIFDTTIDERTYELAPGDLLAVFTNGLVEARSAARDELGLERVHALTRRYGGHEVDYWGDKLREALEAFLPDPAQRHTDAVALALHFPR